MLIIRLVKVLVPLLLTGILMLIALRFLRGTDDGEKQEGWLYSTSMWRTFVAIFLGFGLYFFLTRFFH